MKKLAVFALLLTSTWLAASPAAAADGRTVSWFTHERPQVQISQNCTTTTTATPSGLQEEKLPTYQLVGTGHRPRVLTGRTVSVVPGFEVQPPIREQDWEALLLTTISMAQELSLAVAAVNEGPARNPPLALI